MVKIKKIYSVLLSGVIAITGIGIGTSLVFEKNQSPYTGSTIVYTTPIIEEESNISIVDEYDEYTQLYNQLNDIVMEKKFSSEAVELIQKSFDGIYNNYDLYEEVYKFKNPISKKEYIQKLFIDNIQNNINTINIVDFSLDENKDINKFTGSYVPSTKEINLGVFGEFTENDYDVFIHELSHINQENIINMELDVNLYRIMTEGESVCSQKLNDNKPSLIMTGLVYKQPNTNDYYSIKGIYTVDNNYTIYSKCYGMLSCIVDHDVLEEVKKSKDLNCIINYINNNYDIDGTELLNKMSELCDNCKDNNDPLVCKNLEYLEQSINKCFYKDIQNLDSSEDVINLMNMKRYYDMQFATKNLTNFNDSYDFSIGDDSKLDSYNINDLLYKKAKEYGVIPEFSNDEAKDRQVFGILMLEGTDYDSYFCDNEQRNIKNMKYGLSEDENILVLFNSNDEAIVSYDFQNNKSIRNSIDIDASGITPIEIFNKVESKRI